MHRVDAPGNVANLHTDGNPATGQQATQVRAAWLNDTQENICTVIEDAGIALVKGDGDQLSAAIAQLIQNAFDSGSNSNGYWKQAPDGHGGFIIEQWGAIVATQVEGTYTITFPTEFPTDCENVQITVLNSSGSIRKTSFAELESSTPTTATYHIQYIDEVGSLDIDGVDGIEWRAIGR